MSSTSKRNQAELSKRKALREVKFDAAGTAKVDIADEFYDSMLDNNKDKDDVPGSFTSDVTMDQDLLDILKFIQPKGWEHLSEKESKRAKSFKLEERHKKYFVKSNYLYNDSSLLIIAVKCQNYLAVKRIVDFCHAEGITGENMLCFTLITIIFEISIALQPLFVIPWIHDHTHLADNSYSTL